MRVSKFQDVLFLPNRLVPLQFFNSEQPSQDFGLNGLMQSLEKQKSALSALPKGLIKIQNLYHYIPAGWKRKEMLRGAHLVCVRGDQEDERKK